MSIGGRFGVAPQESIIVSSKINVVSDVLA